MKPSDFYIGLEFLCGPFWWRCTDVGSTTVTATRLAGGGEVVLDEAKLLDAHLTEKDHIQAALDEADMPGHPRYSHEEVMRIIDEKLNGKH